MKLHAELIARLEKNQQSAVVGPMKEVSGPAPVQKSGMSSEETRKFIKEYIGNMDLETRIKNSEKSIS